MYYEEEQVSLFAPATQSTKTSQERSRATPAKTGRQSSPKLSGSQTQTLSPFLFLQKASGTNGEDTWERDLTVGGLLPSGFTMPNGMAFRSVGAESVLSLTTEDGQPTGYCLTLNTGEKPRHPIQSKLSQILEKNPNPKYKLSVKACKGILKRAKKRGKDLPAALEAALVAQSVSKKGQENLEAEKESSSSTNGQALSAPSQIRQYSTVCLEGNGTRESHFGNGWRESDQMYTLNATEQHAVAYGIDQQGGKGGANYSENVSPPILSDSHGTPHAVAYGISPYDSNAMKSSNPNSGIYEADTSRTLDLNGGSPACNQGGIAIVEPTVYNGECITSPTNKANPHPGDPCHTLTDDTRNYLVQAAGFSFGQSAKARSLGYEEEVSPTLRGGEGGNQKPCVYDARGNGDGQIVNTLTGDHQDRITDYTAICLEKEAPNTETYSMQAIGEYKKSDAASSLKMRDYKDATDLVSQVPIGIDRASFNQGANAQFDFSCEENKQPTLTSRGPGGVCAAVDCRNATENPDVNGTLQSKEQGYNVNSNNVCRQGVIVRRLTPKECELLQGFPQNWTLLGEPREVEVKDYEYTYDEDGNETSKTLVGTHAETEYFYTDECGKLKRLADSSRYKALGNSCALPFWEWLDGRISSDYVGTCTLGSLFDGIGAFPLVHARHNGPQSVRWASEIEPYPIAVTKSHFGDEEAGVEGDIMKYLWSWKKE